MDYFIYSDESNHDKSITKKIGTEYDILNVDKPNLSREYTRSYLITKPQTIDDVRTKFIDSENNLRNPKRKDNYFEIKATDCLKISGTKGIEKLEEKYINHLMNCFNLISDSNSTLVLVNYNKIEYVINSSINLNTPRLQKLNKLLNEETIRYSYAKYFQNHYSDSLLNIMFSEKNNQTNYKIKRELNRINKDLSNYPLKKNEYRVGKNLVKLIDELFVSFSPRKYYSWDYELETDLILNKIQEDTQNTYSFIFDGGTKVSKVLMRKLDNHNQNVEVSDSDSKEDTMIRFVDWMATFFGKLFRSYSNSMKMDIKNDREIALSTVSDIERSWFHLNEIQFSLLELIGSLIKNKNIIFLQGVLADNSIGLKNYIEYVSTYNSYNEFIQKDLYIHGKENNIRLQETWQDYYLEKKIYFSKNEMSMGITNEYIKNMDI
ncbi:hypothetical protein [Vagococcus lutrae]|uniref:hypothetical protein n=1 Tax=Vagococcus lutrae TaxID=81947 RepID=UPI002A81A826|nr:hypothetical protein [Vagococcus lutrae]MDY3706648.1 hypothetical protein [Vagococcus lutrae]